MYKVSFLAPSLLCKVISLIYNPLVTKLFPIIKAILIYVFDMTLRHSSYAIFIPLIIVKSPTFMDLFSFGSKLVQKMPFIYVFLDIRQEVPCCKQSFDILLVTYKGGYTGRRVYSYIYHIQIDCDIHAYILYTKSTLFLIANRLLELLESRR